MRSAFCRGVSLSACLDQFLDNLASWSLFGLSQEHARRVWPGFGRNPNPGLASASEPRGGSVMAGSGGLPSPWAIYW